MSAAAAAGQRRIHAHDRLVCQFEDGCIPPASEALMHLVGRHAQEVLADTDAMVKAAEGRARQIPDVPELARELAALRAVVAELVMDVAVLKAGQQECDQQREQQRGRR